MSGASNKDLVELKENHSHPEKITKEQWKASALAGMASYLDAGSIVALGAGLALFQEYLNLSNSAVGLLAAIGPNAIGCAIGSIIGGRLGDKWGRKRIYQIDLLVYAFGVLLIAFCFNATMLFVGTFIVGVAVGADVPTSLAFVGEVAPIRLAANCSALHRWPGLSALWWCSGWLCFWQTWELRVFALFFCIYLWWPWLPGI
jgi:MFS family permease